MQEIWQKVAAFKYFKEVAFVVALLLIIWAWKNGIEGIVGE